MRLCPQAFKEKALETSDTKKRVVATATKDEYFLFKHLINCVKSTIQQMITKGIRCVLKQFKSITSFHTKIEQENKMHLLNPLGFFPCHFMRDTKNIVRSRHAVLKLVFVV